MSEPQGPDVAGRPIATMDDAAQEIARLDRLLKRCQQDNRMLSTMNDNAERLRRFNDSERKLQYLYNDLLLENVPNMIFLFNEELCFVICSLACLPFLASASREDLKNTPIAQVFSADLAPAWPAKVAGQCAEVVDGQTSFSYDDTITFTGGGFIHAQVSISPIVGEDNIGRGVILSVNDITELIETKHSAEEAARSKSSFLASMSHEIRTPMNAIKGLSELLSLTKLDGLQRNYVNNIISSSNSLINIINDVLDFSKIDANKVELMEGPYRVAELLAEVTNVVSLRSEGKDLTILVEADPAMPCEMWGDDVRLKQVMVNLMGNAVKYTHEGYARLRLYTRPGAEGPLLCCEVEDTGVGIHKDELPTLFEAFTRADLRANRSITGTGLGLAISRQLVTAMGGQIEVESRYGEGSVFRFWVPQRAVDEAPLAKVDDPAALSVLVPGEGLRMDSIADMLKALGVACTRGDSVPEGTCHTHCIYDGALPRKTVRRLHRQLPGCFFATVRDMQGALETDELHDTILFAPLLITDLARFLGREAAAETDTMTPAGDSLTEDFAVQDTRLLVVDDNEVNLMVSGEMLRAFGAEVACALSGAEALELCAGQAYDIIFMDHMMPGMDGVEVTARIRAEEGPNRQTPIVALTANVMNDIQSYYVRAGMDDFIGKPVEFTDIARILVRWLPPDKICLDADAVRRLAELPSPEAAAGYDDEGEELNAAQLVEALDAFGMYATTVVREMNGDYAGYLARLEKGADELAALLGPLEEAHAAADWDEYARLARAQERLLHGLGARDCADRARKLAKAAAERNISYIHGDFKSLMGNMYMLEKKLQVLVPLIRRGRAGDAFNNSEYLLARLREMGPALAGHDTPAAMALLGDLAGNSLDKHLDAALKEIKVDLEQGNFKMAVEHHAQALTAFSSRVRQG